MNHLKIVLTLTFTLIIELNPSYGLVPVLQRFNLFEEIWTKQNFHLNTSEWRFESVASVLRRRRDTAMEGCIVADMSRMPRNPNHNSVKVLECLMTVANGAIMEFAILEKCLERQNANLDDPEVSTWFGIHYSSNFDTCIDELMARFHAPSVEPNPDADSNNVPQQATDVTTVPIANTQQSTASRFVSLVCLRFEIQGIPTAVIPCPYFEGPGSTRYDLSDPESLADFVENSCDVTIDPSDNLFFSQDDVRRTIKVYPASESYLCTTNEGEFDLQHGDGEGGDTLEAVVVYYIAWETVAQSSIAAVCLIMTILTFITLCYRGYYKKHPINVYFLAIAMADATYLVVKLIDLLYGRSIWRTGLYTINFDMVVLKEISVGCFLTGSTTYFCKAFILFLTLVVTLERFNAIQFPIKAKMSASKIRALKITSIALVLALVVSFGNILAMESAAISNYDFSITMCSEHTIAGLDTMNMNIDLDFFGYNTEICIFILFVFWLTPYTLVAIFSFVIPALLFWKRYQRSKLTSASTAAQKREYIITMMFSIVTVTTFLFLIPDVFIASYYNTLYPYANAMRRLSKPFAASETIINFFFILELVSCGKNFILYLLVTTEFRLAHIDMWKALWGQVSGCFGLVCGRIQLTRGKANDTTNNADQSVTTRNKTETKTEKTAEASRSNGPSSYST